MILQLCDALKNLQSDLMRHAQSVELVPDELYIKSTLKENVQRMAAQLEAIIGEKPQPVEEQP